MLRSERLLFSSVGLLLGIGFGASAQAFHVLKINEPISVSSFVSYISTVYLFLSALLIAILILPLFVRLCISKKFRRAILIEVLALWHVDNPSFSYPRFWKAFSWLIPRKTRMRVFDPAYADLMLDYCEMPQPKTKLGKAYRHFVFVTHTILLVLDTLRATAAAKIFDLVVGVFRTPRT